MIFTNDSNLISSTDGFEIVNRAGRRRITHVIHDIDGTHSLIRNWPPVMSICLYDVIQNGLPDDFDSEENKRKLIKNAGTRDLPETDKFCIESAGLSALTQMEWAIRCGLQEGSITIPDYRITKEDLTKNDTIINEIWQGREEFGYLKETPSIGKFLSEYVPRLFRLYENVLGGACRDANLEAASKNPVQWRVPGSLEFLMMLRQGGVLNYFVTGAVLTTNERGRPEGMLEEVMVLGYSVGSGNIIEGMYGSSWDKKITKLEAMQRLIASLNIQPENILIIGDGRAEMQAARDIGSLAISRLPLDGKRQREIHRNLGTNYIVSDYTNENFKKLFSGHPDQEELLHDTLYGLKG